MAENNMIADALKLIEEKLSFNSKHYYLIRTDQGRNYNQFADNNFVALNYTNHPIGYLSEIIRNYTDSNDRVKKIREKLLDFDQHDIINLTSRNGERMEGGTLTLTANQIYTVAYGIQNGDIVIIPDKNSHRIRIGRITDDCLASDIEAFSYARHVQWIKEIPKSRLDPCLYRALGANQAVCDVTKYAEIIERNYTSYFSVKDTYFYVLTVNTPNVSAMQLTGTIYSLLQIAQSISNDFNLGIDIEAVNFTINVNSPGKFSFASSAAAAILIMATSSSIFGGDIRYDEFETSTDGAFNTLVNYINEYRRCSQALSHKDQLFQRALNSLEIKAVEDINNAVDEVEVELEEEVDGNTNLVE